MPDRLPIHLIIDTLPDGVLWIQPDGTIGGCNPAFLNMSGISKEMVTKIPLSEVEWAPASFPLLITQAEMEHVQAVEKMLRQEKPGQHYNETFQKIVGQARLWLEFLITPLSPGESALFIFRNVSDRERSLSQMRLAVLRAQATEAEMQEAMREANHLREKAEHANAAKSDFLSGMSHELRTPLHAIRNYALNALKHLGDSDVEKLAKYITNIYLSGDRLSRLINNVLDFSKMEAGKLHYHFRQDSLLIAIEQAVNELQILLDNKEIKVTIRDESASCETEIDRERMVQVFVNLLSNAIKFSPPNGEITIFIQDTRREDDSPALLVQVQDQGKGIPEADMEHIFTKYGQSSTNEAIHTGTGLGLSICQTIITEHQGKIWAENHEDGGACFAFIIPCSRSA